MSWEALRNAGDLESLELDGGVPGMARLGEATTMPSSPTARAVQHGRTKPFFETQKKRGGKILKNRQNIKTILLNWRNTYASKLQAELDAANKTGMVAYNSDFSAYAGVWVRYRIGTLLDTNAKQFIDLAQTSRAAFYFTNPDENKFVAQGQWGFVFVRFRDNWLGHTPPTLKVPQTPKSAAKDFQVNDSETKSQLGECMKKADVLVSKSVWCEEVVSIVNYRDGMMT